MSIELLLSRQNPDGGWPYRNGSSWTEPTVYAVMALLAAGRADDASRGLRWLTSAQRRDGGWPPQPAVDESTWVTGLLALLPIGEALPAARHAAAIQWLMETVGHESTIGYRVREWLLGNVVPADQEFAGWPWIPGAAAWVGPTSIALLALGHEYARRPSSAIRDRILTGRKFLFCRMCQGGGWNHGSARPLGYDSNPYPETTGMALAALRGVATPEVDEALTVARGFLAACRSADALNWLRLGMLAHGGLPADFVPPPNMVCRTVPELSLSLLLQQGDAFQRFFWAAA
jgi:hypothetical protein